MKKLKDVPIRVTEGSNPSTPVLLFRRPDEGNVLTPEPGIDLMDVLYSKVNHYPERIPGFSWHLVMSPDA